MNKIIGLLFICLLWSTFSFAQYGVDNLPNPKQNGQDKFVSNPDGILSSYAVVQLDSIAKDIERQTSAEVAVAVVADFKGEDDFEFALELFNAWGIGKKENNNGLLLFVARDRHAYRFISGYGMEAILPDVVLKGVGEKDLVPYFKLEDYDQGVLTAMQHIREMLLSPEKAAELKADLRKQSFFFRYQYELLSSLLIVVLMFALLKWIAYVAEKKIIHNKSRKRIGKNWLPLLGGCGCLIFTLFIGIFVLLFWVDTPEAIFQMKLVPWYVAFAASMAIAIKYNEGKDFVRKSYRDEKNRLHALAKYHKWMALPLLLSPISLVSFFIFLRKKKRMAVRFVPPDNTGNWNRLDRDDLNKRTNLLNAGQLKEEQELSRSYQLWKNKITDEVKAVGWPGIKAKNFSECPACHHYTFENPFIKTIKAATYSATGVGEELQECAFCKHRISLGKVTLAKKVRSSSSGGSSGSSGSGSSSSSGSSGSFGGGSSGGGGAGGRW